MKKWTSLLLAAVLLTVLCVATFATFVSAKTVTNDVDIPISNYGYVHSTTIPAQLLASGSDATTIGALCATKDANYQLVIITDADGKVTATNFTLGRPDGAKTDVAVPANSYVILVHGEAGAQYADAVKSVKVNDTVAITLDEGKSMADVAAIEGKQTDTADESQKATAAKVTITTSEEVENVVGPMDETKYNAVLATPAADDSVAGWDDKALFQNAECKTEGMKAELVRDVEGGELNTVTLKLYVNKTVMIGYPEGNAVVEISTDGTTYTKVGEYALTAANYDTAANFTTKISLGENKTASKVKVTLTVGSNQAVLGDSPADGKVNWEFICLSGFQTSVETVPDETTSTPDETTSTPDETTSTADETTSTADETTSTADVTTSEESSTAATSSEESSAAATSSEEASSNVGGGDGDSSADNNSAAGDNSATGSNAASSTAATSGTTSSTPTGDAGIIVFAVIGVIALGGAVVAIRVRH